MFVRKIVAILFLVAQAGVAAADGISPHPGDYAQLVQVTDTNTPQPTPHPGDYAQ